MQLNQGQEKCSLLPVDETRARVKVYSVVELKVKAGPQIPFTLFITQLCSISKWAFLSTLSCFKTLADTQDWPVV